MGVAAGAANAEQANEASKSVISKKKNLFFIETPWMADSIA